MSDLPDEAQQRLHVDFTVLEDVLVLNGELVSATAPMLDDAVDRLELATGDLVVDLAELHWIDPVDVSRLVWLHQRLADAGGQLRLLRPRALIRRVLTFFGLVTFLPL